MKTSFLAAVVFAALAAFADNGGYLRRPIQGKVVTLVNAQSRVEAAEIDKAAEGLRAMLSLPIEIADEADSVRTGLEILIAEADNEPVITIWPDAGRARLNIAPLAADGADTEKLTQRVGKQLWRAAGLALGAGYSTFQPDLMTRVASLAALDALPDRPCPATYNLMMDGAHGLGIEAVRMVPYAVACAEHWAPPPTNDVQRIIWEKVKAEQSEKPTNPIKIKPGMKPKGK